MYNNRKLVGRLFWAYNLSHTVNTKTQTHKVFHVYPIFHNSDSSITYNTIIYHSPICDIGFKLRLFFRTKDGILIPFYDTKLNMSGDLHNVTNRFTLMVCSKGLFNNWV